MRSIGTSLAILAALAGCTPGRSPSAAGDAATTAPAPSPSAPSAAATSTRAVTTRDDGTISERITAGQANTSTAGPAIITAAALADRMDATRARLEAWIKPGVTDEKLPWALAHGLLAFGPQMRARDGRLAIDVIVGAAEVRGKRAHFPPKTPSGAVVDAHANLMVKKMIEAGVPWDHAFQVKGLGKVTLERLALDAVAGFQAPNSDEVWADAPWTVIIALLEAKRRDKLDAPARRQLTALALMTLAQLETEQDFLMALLEEQRPDKVEKKKQHIYAHSCGGLHFIQAGLHAAAFIGTAEAYARARKQLEVLMFRWIAERDIYRRAGNAQPQYRLLVFVQEMKFYGHILEVFALAHQLGLVQREPELLVQLGGVAQDLLRTLDLLAPAYGQLDRLRQTSEQTYLDVVGDGAHAVHGLREASMAFFRPR